MTWVFGAFFAFVVIMVSYRMHLLTAWGACFAFFMGWTIFGIGQFSSSVPILLFFVSSSILSKVGNQKKSSLSTYFQKSSERDSWQILANGLIPTILLILWYKSKNSIYSFLFLASIASATADTWATELGVLSKAYPRSILNFRKVQPGTSGGVSILGMLAAVWGALTIAAVGLPFFSFGLGLVFSWKHLLIVTVIGIVGQIIDSILGAVFQAKYECENCGSFTERTTHCLDSKTVIISGCKWINNDMVNFLSVLASVAIGWIVIERLLN